MGFRDTIDDFEPSRKRWLIIFLVLGIVCILVGVTFDWINAPFWNQLNYIANIFAGLTGFFIGVPIALVILGTVTDERESNATQKRINGMSKIAWADFLTAYRDFCTGERKFALQNTAVEANKMHNEALTSVQAYIAAASPAKRLIEAHRTSTEEANWPMLKAHQNIGPYYEPFKAAVDPITAVLGDRDLIETQWSALLGAWQVLDQFVRLQRLEQKLEWFLPEDKTVDADFRRLMSRTPNPLISFAEIHGKSPNAPGAAKTMANAVGTIKYYSDMSVDELENKLIPGNEHYFGYDFVKGYLGHASQAANFLVKLENCVNKVLETNWPASAQKPVQSE